MDMRRRMKKKTLAGILLFGLGAASVGLTAVAQPYGQGRHGPGHMGGYGPGFMGGYGPCWQDDGEKNVGQWRERMQQRRADLHDRLQLNPEQEKAWKDYQAVISANMEAMLERERIDFSGMPAPQRLERMQQLMREREARMTGHLEALKTFYATLTPEQQQIFDAETGTGPSGRYHRGRWHRSGSR
jgi:Spy/CpxP family protein refolding chaperone